MTPIKKSLYVTYRDETTIERNELVKTCGFFNKKNIGSTIKIYKLSAFQYIFVFNDVVNIDFKKQSWYEYEILGTVVYVFENKLGRDKIVEKMLITENNGLYSIILPDETDRDYNVADKDYTKLRAQNSEYSNFVKVLDKQVAVERTEYRYDLRDMIYNPNRPNAVSNGYLVYTKNEFINYYGEKYGLERWNDNRYSSFCCFEGDDRYTDPPKQYLIKNNISVLTLSICENFDSEFSFNMFRHSLTKHLIEISKYSSHDDNPTISLRADLNNEIYTTSCWYTFYFYKLDSYSKYNLQKLIININGMVKQKNMVHWKL
jgi:hypothetical protein